LLAQAPLSPEDREFLAQLAQEETGKDR